MRKIFAIAAAIVFATEANSLTIHENDWTTATNFRGWSSGGYIIGNGGWQVYDDFNVSNDSLIESITVLARSNSSGGFLHQNITIAIFDSTRTTELYRLTGSLTSSVIYGSSPISGSAYAWEATFDLVDQAIQTGNYWLATDIPTWSGRNPGSGSIQERTFPTFTTYNRSEDLLFRLEGSQIAPVPLPSSLSVFLIGMTGLGLVARRRRNR